MSTKESENAENTEKCPVCKEPLEFDDQIDGYWCNNCEVAYSIMALNSAKVIKDE